MNSVNTSSFLHARTRVSLSFAFAFRVIFAPFGVRLVACWVTIAHCPEPNGFSLFRLFIFPSARWRFYAGGACVVDDKPASEGLSR